MSKIIPAKLLIEVQCEECQGSGKVYITSKKALEPTQELECSDCDGTGYTQLKISLQDLKNLLDGGTL